MTRPGSDVAATSSGIQAVQIGAIIGLIAILIVLGVILPTGNKLVVLAKSWETAGTNSQTGTGTAESTDMQALQRRLVMARRIGVLLLALTLITMIIGAEI